MARPSPPPPRVPPRNRVGRPAAPGPTSSAPPRAGRASAGAPPARGLDRPPARPPTGPGRRPARSPYRQRRLVALALVVTVVAGVAYGLTTLFGSDADPGSGSAAATSEVPTLLDHSIGVAFGAIATGLGMRNLRDQYQVRDSIDGSIAEVRQDRVGLEAAAAEVTGARADALAAGIAASGSLEAALAQWRDAVFNLRFGQIDAAQSATNDAITALARARDAWNAAEPSS